MNIQTAPEAVFLWEIHMLDWCIKKLNEVANDLREPQDGSDLEHQAKKLDRVGDELRAIRELIIEPKEPDASTQVHGGGTGKD